MSNKEPLKQYNPDTGQWEGIKAGAISDGIDVVTPDTVLKHMTEVKKQIKVRRGVNILANGWTLNQSTFFYEYRINDANISVDTIVDVNIKVGDLGKARELKSANESFNGYVLLYADAKPTENISCDMKMIRQVF